MDGIEELKTNIISANEDEDEDENENEEHPETRC